MEDNGEIAAVVVCIYLLFMHTALIGLVAQYLSSANGPQPRMGFKGSVEPNQFPLPILLAFF